MEPSCAATRTRWLLVPPPAGWCEPHPPPARRSRACLPADAHAEQQLLPRALVYLSFHSLPCPPLDRLQALASALGFGFSGAVALACTTALLGLAGVWASAGLAVCAGELPWKGSGAGAGGSACLGDVEAAACVPVYAVLPLTPVHPTPPPHSFSLTLLRSPPLPPPSGLFLACVLTMLAASLCVAALVSGTMAFGAFSRECRLLVLCQHQCLSCVAVAALRSRLHVPAWPSLPIRRHPLTHTAGCATHMHLTWHLRRRPPSSAVYAAVVCSLACLRLAGRVLLGPPRAALAALQQQQQQQQPEKPTGALQAATGADSYAGSQRGRPATAQLPAAAGDALEPATAGVNAASTAGAKQLPRSLADSA